MKEMKTLTLPNGITYEIVDDKARNDISKFERVNKRASAPPIAQTASGCPIAVDDSAERPLNGLKLFGKTTQVTTTGKQLVNINSSTKTTSGITFTPNADGSISLSGTATAEAYYIFDNGNVVTNAGTELTASISGSDNVYMVVGYYKADNTVVNDIVTVTNNVPATFTYPAEAAATRTFLGVQNGKTVNVTVYPMIRLATVTDGTFEPYTGGMPAPNPNYPQELNSVENPNVSVFGGNLCDLPDMTNTVINGITWFYKDGVIYANGTATAQSNVGPSVCTLDLEPGTYTLSGGVNGILVIVYRLRNGVKTYFTSKNGNYVTFDVENGDALYLYGQVSNGNSVVAAAAYPIVNAGTIPVNWEPYKAPQTLALNRTLHGIPVTSNGNYTDSNGQQWICDEIDFERGVYIQRVGIATMDTCSVIEYTVLDSNGRAQLIAAPQLSKNQHIYGTMCNVASINPAPLEAVSGEYYENPANIVFVGDVGESESSIKEKYANFEYCYILAIPIETALTEEELAGFEPLYSHSTSTTVLNDSGAWMEITYSADLASWAKQHVSDISGGNAENGKDGFSPIATVTQTNTGAVISITDKNGTTTATITNGKDGQDGEDAIAPDDIPSYWQTALDEGVEAINTALCEAGRNKSAFLFYSDAHWNYGSQMAPTLLKYLYNHTGMTKTFFGGDIVNNEDDNYDTMKYLWNWRNQLKGLPNHHSVVGNHDDGNSTNNLFSEQYVYGYLLSAEETPDMVVGDNGLYYYIDNPAEKTRYLCLDTAYKGVDSDQTTFVTEALKSTPANWHIVVISHIWYMPDYNQINVRPIPITGLDSGASTVAALLDSYNARSGDFADCGAWVEFCIGGHVHIDYDGKTPGGIPVILVETDSQHIRSTLSYTAGTITESSVNGVIADYDNGKIHVVRIGRGESREITISNNTVSYTNVLPLSLAADGASVYNAGGTPGYKANTRWSQSSQADQDRDGQYITGWIPLKQYDVLRFKNMTMGSDIAILYANNPGSTAGSIGYDTAMSWNGASDDSGNLVQFEWMNTQPYIRIQCTYIGPDSIITVNEPIE